MYFAKILLNFSAGFQKIKEYKLKLYNFFVLLIIVFSCNSNAVSIENRSNKIVLHEKTFVPVSKTDYFDNVTSANLTIASTRAVEMNEYLFYIALVENEPFPYVIRKGGKAPPNSTPKCDTHQIKRLIV
jgi:hypothetical protein